MTKTIPFVLLLLACSAPAEEILPEPGPTAGAPGAGEAGAQSAGSPSSGGSESGGQATAGAAQGGTAGSAPVAGASAAGAGASAGGQSGGGGGAPAAGAAGLGGSAGSVAHGGGGSGSAGQAGAAGAPAANACMPPTTDPVLDCTGKCGGSANCAACGQSMDLLGTAEYQYDRWVVIKANGGTACGGNACDGSVFGFTLQKGACGRFTSMKPVSGSAPTFSRNTAFGSPKCEAWSACTISIGSGTDVQPNRLGNTYVASGTVDAWIHAEGSPVNADGSCPLACP